jgi:hypothetical protein
MGLQLAIDADRWPPTRENTVFLTMLNGFVGRNEQLLGIPDRIVAIH